MALLSRDDGVIAAPGQEQQLEAAGYKACYTTRWKRDATNRWIPCPFWLSPETQTYLTDKAGGYYTCPTCRQSHDLLTDMPWHGVPEDETNYEYGFTAGGGTRIGLPMQEQAQIGEDLLEKLGQLPGYGPITWWHPGGAIAPSPLDGATKDWGIEVKTLGYDAMHHRFIPGRPRERSDKNEAANVMGKRGVLGVLVLLDYRRSVADIYVKEMPLGDREVGTGQVVNGVTTFRSSSGMHLVKEVPFKNPLMDPRSPSPVSNEPLGGDYESDMPF